MKNEQKELAFPENVVDRNDFIPGFGGKELGITGIAFGISIAIIIIGYLSSGSVFLSIMAGVGILAVTLLMIRRDRFDESAVDKAKFVISYYKSQHRFEYDYYNIYEGRYASDEKK